MIVFLQQVDMNSWTFQYLIFSINIWMTLKLSPRWAHIRWTLQHYDFKSESERDLSAIEYKIADKTLSHSTLPFVGTCYQI